MSELNNPTIQSANFNRQTDFADLKTGYYTIVFPEQNTHRTLRIERAKYGKFEGKLIISKLTGPDNTSDYTGLAHIENDATPYGKTYALKSGNCFRCNTLLTNPESIENGIGPICIKKM